MNDTPELGLHQAAIRLGVPVRVLRHAIRAGKLPALPRLTATSTVPAAWFDSAQAALDASPNRLGLSQKQTVPPFARYAGTSAWRKYRNRVREYARFHAAAGQPAPAATTTGG